MTDSLKQGQVVLLADGGALTPWRVMGFGEAGVTIANADAGTREVHPGRLFWMTQHMAPDLAAMNAYWKSLREAVHTCDLSQAWDALLPDFPESAVPIERLATVLGLSPPLQAAAVLAIFDDGLYFKVRRRDIFTTSPERVETLQLERERAREEERFIDQAVRAIQGRLAELEGERPPALDFYIKDLVSLASVGRQTSRNRQAEALLDALGLTGDDSTELAFQLLVDLGEFKSHENLAVHRAGVTRIFPEGCEQAARELIGDACDQREPRDLTHLYTVAVDAPTTTEVDDAFAVDGDTLYIFIADAAARIRAGSTVDKEARGRLATLYVADGKIRMLPAVLGDEILSLKAGANRPTLVFASTWSQSGTMVATEIFEATCRVDRRIGYETTDYLLTGAEPDDPATAMLEQAEHWMAIHLRKRFERGAMSFPRHEAHFSSDEEGKLTLDVSDPDGRARQLIAEMMVMVGSQAAAFCKERSIPALFRRQDPADLDLPDGRVTDPYERHQVLRQLKPTNLSVSPGPHGTLGLEAYVQVTSPIRRWADLLMQRQIKASLRGDAIPYGSADLRGIVHEMEARLSSNKRVERESHRFHTLRYLQQHPELELTAIPIKRWSKRVLVEVPSLAIQFSYVPQGKVRLGRAISLRVVAVHPRRDEITLEEVT